MKKKNPKLSNRITFHNISRTHEFEHHRHQKHFEYEAVTIAIRPSGLPVCCLNFRLKVCTMIQEGVDTCNTDCILSF